MSMASEGIATFAAAAGVTPEEALKVLQKNALSKQYDMSVVVKIVETGSGKAYFDNTFAYTGVPYPGIVMIEAALVNLVNELTQVGKAIATGKPPAA